MPNQYAKQKKRTRRLLNEKFKKEGRTKAQRKRKRLKKERKNDLY